MKDRLKSWLVINGIKECDFALMLGVNKAYIYHLLAGRRYASPKIAVLIEKKTKGYIKMHELLSPFRRKKYDKSNSSG